MRGGQDAAEAAAQRALHRAGRLPVLARAAAARHPPVHLRADPRLPEGQPLHHRRLPRLPALPPLPPQVRPSPGPGRGLGAPLSPSVSPRSLFILSNESVNIWSHLLGFLLFFTLGIRDLTVVLPAARAAREDFVICAVCLFCFQVGHRAVRCAADGLGGRAGFDPFPVRTKRGWPRRGSRTPAGQAEALRSGFCWASCPALCPQMALL